LNNTNIELQSSNEELQASSEQLEASFQQIADLSENLEMIIALTSKMSTASEGNETEFLKNILEMVVSLIPNADNGSVSVFEGEKWVNAYSIGQDRNFFNSLNLNKNEYPKSGGKIIIWNNPYLDGEKSLSKKAFVLLEKSLKRSRQRVFCDLTVGEKTVGSLSINIISEQNSLFTGEDLRIFEAFSNVASAFLTTQRFRLEQERFQNQLLMAMIKVLELYDPYTKGHSEHVAEISRKISVELGMDEKESKKIYWAGLVHDVGKILVPINILGKDGSLTREEFDIMKMHPVWGASVLETGEELEDIVAAVRHHHEFWNGEGYPQAMSGEKIPLMSRIISIADAFDAMTSDRPYRKALSKEIAILEIEKNAGKQFDPAIAQVFLKKEFVERL
jgi:HD-GYP domain-containing protein (c-di-GMP phosphodiesterase class II)